MRTQACECSRVYTHVTPDAHARDAFALLMCACTGLSVYIKRISMRKTNRECVSPTAIHKARQIMSDEDFSIDRASRYFAAHAGTARRNSVSPFSFPSLPALPLPFLGRNLWRKKKLRFAESPLTEISSRSIDSLSPRFSRREYWIPSASLPSIYFHSFTVSAGINSISCDGYIKRYICLQASIFPENLRGLIIATMDHGRNRSRAFRRNIQRKRNAFFLS
jgi:hypothetical protein